MRNMINLGMFNKEYSMKVNPVGLDPIVTDIACRDGLLETSQSTLLSDAGSTIDGSATFSFEKERADGTLHLVHLSRHTFSDGSFFE